MLLLVFTVATPLSFGVPAFDSFTCIRSAPYHPAIHNLGNVGYLGGIHANGAVAFTSAIDRVAYKGRNMRREVAEGMASVHSVGSSLVEIGCGVGTLTRELEHTNTYNITAVDTSREMLNVAETLVTSPLECINGVDIGSLKKEPDVVITCMMMHELPKLAHEEFLGEVWEVVANRRGELWIVDLDPSYTPGSTMIAGEPYVTEYIDTFEDTIDTFARGNDASLNTFSIVEGHVRGWVLTLDTPPVVRRLLLPHKDTK